MKNKLRYFLVLFLSYFLVFVLTTGYFYYSYKREFLSNSTFEIVQSILENSKKELQEGNYRGFLERVSRNKIHGKNIRFVALYDNLNKGVLGKSTSAGKWTCDLDLKKSKLENDTETTTVCYKVNSFLSLQLSTEKITFAYYLKRLNYYAFVGLLFILFVISALLQLYTFNEFLSGMLSFITNYLSTSKPEALSTSDYKRFVAPIDEMKQKLTKLEVENINLQTSKAKAMIARQVVHDIKSPLMALEVVFKKLDTNIENDTKLGHLALNRVKEICEDLQFIDINNTSKGVVPLSSVVTGLKQIVEEKRVERLQGGNEKIILINNLVTSGLSLKGDIGRFNRIFSNILNNSIEAASKDRDLCIIVKSEVEGDDVVFNFEDNGTGIAPDILKKIGTEEVSSKNKDQISAGEGIGLLSAYMYIQGLSGKILVDSKQQEGTKIKVVLPLKKINQN